MDDICEIVTGGGGGGTGGELGSATTNHPSDSQHPVRQPPLTSQAPGRPNPRQNAVGVHPAGSSRRPAARSSLSSQCPAKGREISARNHPSDTSASRLDSNHQMAAPQTPPHTLRRARALQTPCADFENKDIVPGRNASYEKGPERGVVRVRTDGIDPQNHT